MKNIFFVALFFIGLINVNAQDAKWYDSFEEAAEVSKKTNKPILANFTGSDWCGWCKRLDKEVFSQDEFIKWADENVVLLTVDFPRRKQLSEKTKAQNDALQRGFQVKGFPTIWLMNPGIGDIATEGIVPLGKTGYVKGGAKEWIASIAPAIPSK